MGLLGNCCCVPPNCETACDAYLPATTWPITVLGQTFNLVRHPTYRCLYYAEHCWLGSVVEEAAWTLSDGWEDDPAAPVAVPNRCRPDCYDGYGAGFVYDVVQSQTHYRVSAKRYSQERYYLTVWIAPIGPLSNMLTVSFEYSVAKTWFHGASQTAHSRYRVSVITCPSTVTIGSWISAAAPTMLSVEQPSFFNGCFIPIYNDFVGGCLLPLGAVVAETPWGATSLGTYRQLNTTANQEPCAVYNQEYFVPNDIAIRKSVFLPIIPSYRWAPCVSIWDLDSCDSRGTKTRQYYSTAFACDSIPASVVADSGAAAIAATSTARTCGAVGFTDTFPEIPATATVTL